MDFDFEFRLSSLLFGILEIIVKLILFMIVNKSWQHCIVSMIVNERWQHYKVYMLNCHQFMLVS